MFYPFPGDFTGSGGIGGAVFDLSFIFTFTFQSPAKAAPPLVYMGCAVEEEGKSNEYLHMRTRRPMDEKCYEPEAGRRLWEKTEELVRGMV